MDFKSSKAIYLQIADYILDQILLKKWSAQTKIPSVRELAITLEVNPNTIMRSYTFLEEKKVISTRRGIGYFVTESAYKHVLAIKKDEFLCHHLPHVLRLMNLLNISIEELTQLYHEKVTDNR